jgi:hypothetical protein
MSPTTQLKKLMNNEHDILEIKQFKNEKSEQDSDALVNKYIYLALTNGLRYRTLIRFSSKFSNALILSAQKMQKQN